MKTQTVVILVSVAGLTVGGYFLYQKAKANQYPAPVTDPNQRANTNSSTPLGQKVNNVVTTANSVVDAANGMLDTIGKTWGGM